MTERDDQKARYQAYRAAAIKAAAPLYGAAYRVTVNEQAAVHMVEDGAFVEAVVWIPAYVIEETR